MKDCEGQTPKEIARDIRAELDRSIEEGKLRAIGLGTGSLVEDGQPLAAFHLLTMSGATETQALSILEKQGVADEVVALLLVPEELSERPDK